MGYGFSLFINGAAGKLFRPRFPLGPLAPGADPLTPLGLVVLVLDPMFLLSSFRFLCCTLLMGGMTFWKDTPWTTGVGESAGSGRVEGGGMTIYWRHLIPVFVGLANAGGYACYLALTARGGVAIWSALVGLYIVIPVLYGIVGKGEARSRRKLLGIAVCILASILLGWGEGTIDTSGPVSQVPWWSNALLFLFCIALWGVCDGLSAFMGRDLHMWWVVGLTGLGFGVVALVCSLLTFFITGLEGAQGLTLRPSALAVNATGGAAFSSGSSIPVGWGYVCMFVAQVFGILAWFLSVKAGVLSEASAFLPIISLYTCFASLLAVVFLGEKNLGWQYWVGVIVGAAGILLIAYSDAGALESRQRLQEEEQAGPPSPAPPLLQPATPQEPQGRTNVY